MSKVLGGELVATISGRSFPADLMSAGLRPIPTIANMPFMFSVAILARFFSVNSCSWRAVPVQAHGALSPPLARHQHGAMKKR